VTVDYYNHFSNRVLAGSGPLRDSTPFREEYIRHEKILRLPLVYLFLAQTSFEIEIYHDDLCFTTHLNFGKMEGLFGT